MTGLEMRCPDGYLREDHRNPQGCDYFIRLDAGLPVQGVTVGESESPQGSDPTRMTGGGFTGQWGTYQHRKPGGLT